MVDEFVFVDSGYNATNLEMKPLFEIEKFIFSISTRQQSVDRFENIPKGFTINQVRHPPFLK
jgi:hypothetical protein